MRTLHILGSVFALLVVVTALAALNCTCKTSTSDVAKENTPANVQPMGEDQFWVLIETAKKKSGKERGKECSTQAKLLTEALNTLTKEELEAYECRFRQLSTHGYNNKLWGAAYLIQGGCSDDCFTYFRAWLIGQGRNVYYEACADPDSLAWLTHDYVECEELLGAHWDAYRKVAGKPFDTKCDFRSRGLKGEEWREDDKEYFKTNLPKLWSKFKDNI